MAIHLAGQAIKDVRVAGAQAQRVMLGTGSGAVEVWSASPYPITGTWSGTLTENVIFLEHTPPEDATLSISLTVTGDFGTIGFCQATDVNRAWQHDGQIIQGVGTSSVNVIQAVQAGQRFVLAAAAPYGGGTVSGSWSITTIDSLYEDADYYYPLTGMSLQNEGLKSTPLTSEAGALADRGNHAWLARSKPRINVTESWSSGWTASAWFEQSYKHTKDSAYIFSRGAAARGTAIYLSTMSASPSRLYWKIADGTSVSDWVSQDNLLPTSGWFHFAVTAEYVSPNYNLRFFVNGNMVRSSNMSSKFNNLVFASDDWASFGNASANIDYPYEGNVDDIAMWSRKLTDEEVASIYAEGRSN